MPQMSPLLWLYLFIFFIASFLFFFSMNYFICLFNKSLLLPSLSTKKLEKIWKF